MIYQFIIDNGKLLPHHREQLKTKRGFTDATIDKYKFISCGDYLNQLEEELKKKFTLDQLKASGVFTKKGILADILTKDNILIPYFHQGICTLIRPHKFGLKDIPVQVYETSWDNHIILTESEFKAVAAWQLGFSAIGIPGISVFSKEHFKRLAVLLHNNHVKRITILFDSEIKDNPKFPNYKPDPYNRYDTDYYACLMAEMLDKEGYDVRIGMLPDAWRVDGKIDIDGALAQGKTKEDFERIIAQAKTSNQYRDDLTDEAQKIVKKKLANRHIRSHLSIDNSRYMATRIKGKTEYQEEISNFVIKIIAINDTPDGITREVQFTNTHGEISPIFTLSADKMSNDSFRTFCYSVGNYSWKGQQSDLCALWDLQFLSADGCKIIVEPDHIGWLEDEKLWVFGNIALKNDGKELRPDENGIFWLDKKGIRPIPLVVTTGKNNINTGVASINLGKFDVKEFKDKLSDTIGEMQAAICLGWANACYFMEDVYKLHGCFPFLFFRGLKGHGKTKVASWIWNLFGIEGEGYQIEGTTAVGAAQYLGYYSSLPVLFDDYRNVEKVQIKDGFFRNVYNRQSAGKGLKTGHGIREVRVRGAVFFTGEESPHDAALMERCIPIWISEKIRKKNHLRWFMDNKVNFSRHTYDMIKRKNDIRDTFIRIINEGFEYFSVQGRNSRVSVNYSIVAAGYASVFGEDIDFAKWLKDETERTSTESREETMTSKFLEDIVSLKMKKKVNSNYYLLEEGKIYLYFHGLYNEWSEDYKKRRGEPPFKESALRDYMKDEDGFLSLHFAKKINGITVRCMVFDHKNCPEQLRSLVAED